MLDRLRTVGAMCACLLVTAMLSLGATPGADPAAAAGPPALRPESQSLIVPAAHERCGVSGGNFARTCRPGSYEQCLRAARRGVAGFTPQVCDSRRSACTTCLDAMFACFKKIGHGLRLYTCDRCKRQFDACYAKRWH